MRDPIHAWHEWQASRLAGLKGDMGWLHVIAREVLRPGTWRFGTAAENDIILPAGPAHAGRVMFDGTDVTVFDPAGAPLPLEDHAPYPPRLRIADLLVEFTRLEGETAMRVRDLADPRRAALTGLTYYPFDPAWVIRADWVPLPAPRRQEIDTVAGIATATEVTHEAVFTHDGQEVRLLATHGEADAPMFVLRDRTAGDTTYGAARFLFGSDIAEGQITLDFNRAVTPPCGFTDFATCPLPPPQNRLPFRIEAGELAP